MPIYAERGGENMRIEEVVQHCINQGLSKYCFFMGAGLSIDAGLPSWEQLVEPVAKKIGLDPSDASLTSILEYALGNNKTEYSMFIENFKSQIKRSAPTINHELITKIPINRIWTTNFDDLIEKSFKKQGIDIEIITNDKELINADFTKRQIIKMHGSITETSDDLEDIVLTENQYELFSDRRKWILNLLMNDISNRGFIFLGVSFDDANMRRIWSSVQASRGIGITNFLFTVPPKKQNRKKYKLYELWKNNLIRYNVKVIELNSYKEITRFLRILYINSVGRAIAGIGTYSDDSYAALCIAIGEKMAQNDYSYHNGGGFNISAEIAHGMWNVKPFSMDNLDIVTYYYRENGGSTNPQKGKIIYYGKSYTDIRKLFLTEEKLCLMIGQSPPGRNGMQEEVEIARKQGCKILSIPFTGNLCERVYEEEKSFWKSCLSTKEFELYEKLKYEPKDEEISKYADNVIGIANAYFDYACGGK